MTMFVLSILALFGAPLIYGRLARDKRLFQMLDGFIFVSIGGLILTMIMPESVMNGGRWAFVFMILGLLLPSFSERIFHTSIRRTHLAALVLGISGLALHAVTDGAILGGDHDHHHASTQALALGVVLHRVPIGLTIWWLVRPQYGAKTAWGLLSVIVIGTGMGYEFAPLILEPLTGRGFALFQAFVAGTLFHVVFHRIHAPHDHDHAAKPSGWWEGFGNLLGAAGLFMVLREHSHFQDSSWAGEFMATLKTLSLESAPALLAAFVLAGLVTAFLPKSYATWMSRGRAWQQSLRGVLVGLPLPICSCGVTPLYHSLVRKGAPPVAAMAFLIATPELGLDAVLLSLPLLGESMTLLRVLAAMIVALVVSMVVGGMTPPVEATEAPDETDQLSGVGQKLRYGLTKGMIELVDHTGPWILAGILIAAALDPALSRFGLDWLPDSLEVAFFALLGVPMYVCASGATPLVAVFLAGGVSPGAALAFLMTGPATNLTTFGILKQIHGQKTAVLFALAVPLVTIALGLAANAVLTDFVPLAHADAHQHASPWQQAALVLLVLLFLFSITKRGARAFVGELTTRGGHRHTHNDDHENGHHHHHHHHGHQHAHDHHHSQ